MKVVSVLPLPNYQLEVSFEDGVFGIISLKTFLQNGIFSVLQDEALFKQVKFNQSAIFWNEELEIDLLNIYLELAGKSFDELFPKADYVSN
jgi:hypothetical protein